MPSLKEFSQELFLDNFLSYQQKLVNPPPPSHSGKKSFINLLDPDPEPDDFQKLTVTSSSEDTSLVKFS